MRLRTGVDLVAVSALEAHLASDDSMRDLVWTQEEQRDCRDRPDRLAARWAAKEAVMKALGTGWPDIAWTDIAVTYDSARPRLLLHGEAAAEAQRLGLDQWEISLSHEAINHDVLATAMVVALGTESTTLRSESRPHEHRSTKD